MADASSFGLDKMPSLKERGKLHRELLKPKGKRDKKFLRSLDKHAEDVRVGEKKKEEIKTKTGPRRGFVEKPYTPKPRVDTLQKSQEKPVETPRRDMANSHETAQESPEDDIDISELIEEYEKTYVDDSRAERELRAQILLGYLDKAETNARKSFDASSAPEQEDARQTIIEIEHLRARIAATQGHEVDTREISAPQFGIKNKRAMKTVQKSFDRDIAAIATTETAKGAPSLEGMFGDISNVDEEARESVAGMSPEPFIQAETRAEKERELKAGVESLMKFETPLPPPTNAPQMEQSGARLTMEREAMGRAEAEYLSAYKDFYAKNNVLTRLGKSVLGGTEAVRLEGLKSAYDEKRLSYAQAMGRSVDERLKDRSDLTEQARQEIVKRYNRIVRFNEIVRPTFEKKIAARKEALGAKGPETLERAFSMFGKANVALERHLGKTGARAARAFASSVLMTGTAAAVGAFGTAGMLAAAGYGTVTFGRKLFAATAGTAVGEGLGAWYGRLVKQGAREEDVRTTRALESLDTRLGGLEREKALIKVFVAMGFGSGASQFLAELPSTIHAVEAFQGAPAEPHGDEGMTSATDQPALVTEEAPVEGVEFSVNATTGHGYEYMAKRLWENLQEAKAAHTPLALPAGSDLETLYNTDEASINRVVHELAEKNKFYQADGESVLIRPESRLTFTEDGKLLLADVTRAEGVTEASPNAEVTPLHEEPAAPVSSPESGPLEPSSSEASTEVSADTLVSPSGIFENEHELHINPNETHFFEDKDHNVFVYGKNFDSRFASAQTFAKAHPGVSVYLEANVPALYEGKLQPWVMEVRYNGWFRGMSVMTEPPNETYIHPVDPQGFVKEVQ